MAASRDEDKKKNSANPGIRNSVNSGIKNSAKSCAILHC